MQLPESQLEPSGHSRGVQSSEPDGIESPPSSLDSLDDMSDEESLELSVDEESSEEVVESEELRSEVSVTTSTGGPG